jgi:hypothetical protein
VQKCQPTCDDADNKVDMSDQMSTLRDMQQSNGLASSFGMLNGPQSHAGEVL